MRARTLSLPLVSTAILIIIVVTAAVAVLLLVILCVVIAITAVVMNRRRAMLNLEKTRYSELNRLSLVPRPLPHFQCYMQYH